MRVSLRPLLVLGGYRLDDVLSWEQRLADGMSRQAPNSIGYIIYTDTGYMCYVSMNPNRPKWASRTPTESEALRDHRTWSLLRSTWNNLGAVRSPEPALRLAFLATEFDEHDFGARAVWEPSASPSPNRSWCALIK